MAVAGRAELIGDARYATDEARRENAADVDRIVGEWTRTKTKHEIMAQLSELGIACGAVQDTCEVLQDPHLRARQMVLPIDDPARGQYTALGNPIKIASNEAQITPPPLLGEHTGEVLQSLLNLDAAAIQALRQSGAI